MSRQWLLICSDDMTKCMVVAEATDTLLQPMAKTISITNQICLTSRVSKVHPEKNAACLSNKSINAVTAISKSCARLFLVSYITLL